MSSVDWTTPYANLGVLLLNRPGDRDYRGGNAYGDCPICGKENHFYVDPGDGLCDCKLCVFQGNLTRFLTELVGVGVARMRLADYDEIVEDRGLPRKVFQTYDVCRSPLNPNVWFLPAKAFTGSVVNVYTWRPGERIFGTKGVGSSLTGLEHWDRSATGRHVYVCEGQWDLYAQRCVLDDLGEDADAVGVPGSGFLHPWVKLFAGRHVHLLFDNDDAGRRLSARVSAMLLSSSSPPLSLKSIEWPPHLPAGFDVRDLYRNPKAALRPPRRLRR